MRAMMTKQLLKDIEEFLAETGMGEFRFGLLAARNGRLVERLRAGKTPGGKPILVRPETEEAVRAFMEEKRAEANSEPAA